MHKREDVLLWILNVVAYIKKPNIFQISKVFFGMNKCALKMVVDV